AAEAAPELRRRAQDQRWRLISQGISVLRHEYFGPVVLSEQWAVARMAMADNRSPVGQILAERRLRAIEMFIEDNFPGGLSPLHSLAAAERVAPAAMAATERTAKTEWGAAIKEDAAIEGAATDEPHDEAAHPAASYLLDEPAQERRAARYRRNRRRATSR